MAEVKRGFRKVTLVLPVKEYDLLKQIADSSDRDTGQQAAFIIKSALASMAVQSYREAYREAEERRAEANGALIEPEAPAEVE